MTDIRCIGICTGGGDAPGLNAVIRAAVKCAFLKYNWKVIGIPDGFDGLIWPEKSYELTLKHVSGILPRGGTILGTTNRGNPFKYLHRRKRPGSHSRYFRRSHRQFAQSWESTP